jgi:hypothetical protein
MPYVELEQFLDRGAIRAWWGFSWKTLLGLGAGAVLGQQLGAVIYGSGTAGMAALTALGALLGVVLLLQRRGMIVAKRLLILAEYLLRVATQRTEIDGRTFGTVIPADEPPPMRVRLRTPLPPHDADGAPPLEAGNPAEASS